MIQARPTTYNGIQMRSRLEASFAAHLDNLGEPWTYEPRCFATARGQYLPDFIVRGVAYVEVKPPVADFDAALDRMHIILSSEADADLIVMTRQSGGGFYRVGACTMCPLCSTCGCERLRDTCRRHREEQPANSQPTGFSAGDSVRHPRFGEGTILSIQGEGTQAIAIVRFPGTRDRLLLLDRCPLEKLPARESVAAAARRQLAKRDTAASRRQCDGCDQPAARTTPVDAWDLYLCDKCSEQSAVAQQRRHRIGEQHQCDRCPDPATNVFMDATTDGALPLCDIHTWQATTDGTL